MNLKSRINGVGVDASVGPVVDPTANVIALVEANAKAAADLRVADNRYYDAVMDSLKVVTNLRATHAETLRSSDLDRLDKTRQVDVLAGASSAAQLATAVSTLANTSDRNAETLRNLVNATAATMAKQTSDQAAALSAQTDSLVKDINMRIAELQKASYQGAGRQGVTDPQMAEVLAEMKSLRDSRAAGAGKEQGVSWFGVLIAGAIGVIASLISIGSLVYALMKPANNVAAVAPVPQVVYVPTPPATVAPSK